MSLQDWEPVIGLEVHAQLKTRTKLFCACANSFARAPNSVTCQICLGHPGVLPVLNSKAVELAVRLALATGCRINKRSVFARKNYFYADLPKGYQISQFELPLAEEGFVQVGFGAKARKFGLTRIHMEEDAGKLLHEGEYYSDATSSAVDFNRGGIPLVEIVGKPELRSAEDAGAYLRALHATVVYLDVCDGNMEEGSFRCDANVSVRKKGAEKFGTRIELKNMNSFRNVERAIAYEIERQVKELEAGGTIRQETRTFNADKGTTHAMRSKEEAHDYRYFPEPDLVPLDVPEALLKQALPELAPQKAERYVKDYGLSEYDAGVLTAEKAKAAFFEEAIAAGADAKKAANWITVELFGRLNKAGQEIGQVKLSAKEIASLLKLLNDGAINGPQAKEVFSEMFEKGGVAADIVKAKGFTQMSDEGELKKIVADVIAKNAEQVQKYKSGDPRVLGFFVGEVKKATGGKANMRLVPELVKAALA